MKKNKTIAVAILLMGNMIIISLPPKCYAQTGPRHSALQTQKLTNTTIKKMQDDFTTTILVEKSPEAVYNAITNVRGWWSEEIKGTTAKAGDEFTLQYEDIHRCKIRILESVPGKKVVWQVLENYFKFTKDTKEWTWNRMIFEITPKAGKTQLKFTQVGLVPQYECYEVCSNAWLTYINGSLKDLITTGKGKPNAKGKPQTEAEKRLSTEH